MAWAAFRAPGGQMQGVRDETWSRLSREERQRRRWPPPPEPEGREGLAADIRVAKTLGGEPTPPLGLRALISAAIPSPATHAT